MSSALKNTINLIVLTLLTIFFYLRLKRILNQNFLKMQINYNNLDDEYNKLLRENTKLKEEIFITENTADEIIALYDITKEVCKSLDEEKLFRNFKDYLYKYLQVGDCRFLKPDTDLSKYDNYTVLPLEIDNKVEGYLVANDIRGEDVDKFYILSGQIILGIKRALLYQKVQELAITDSLSGIFTRRYFLERVKEELERAKKQKLNFSFLMIDVDYFKKFNDQYGHLVGDVILREVSETIKENIRQIDALGRYGGDEFSLILSETDIQEAGLVAERIRKAIESQPIRAYDENLKITVSIGISAFPQDTKNLNALIEKADQALYQAKTFGRNKVFYFHK